MAYVDSVYVDTGPKKNPNPKPVIELLEFKDQGIIHFKNRLDKVPYAFVNRFCIDSDGNKLRYSFGISTIAGNYEATTVGPDVAKYLSNCYIDNEPVDLSKSI